MKKALNELKPGDQVILRTSSPYQPDIISNVERLTKTQIIADSKRFNLKTGNQIGYSRSWFGWRIIPATDAELAAIRIAQELREIQEKGCHLSKIINTRILSHKNAAAAITHLEAALACLSES